MFYVKSQSKDLFRIEVCLIGLSKRKLLLCKTTIENNGWQFHEKANNIKHAIFAVQKVSIYCNAMFLYPVLSEAQKRLNAMQCMAN